MKTELKYSELGAKIKFAFNFSDKSDVEKLRKVWAYATDEEKTELQKILKKKENRKKDYDLEFGLKK